MNRPLNTCGSRAGEAWRPGPSRTSTAEVGYCSGAEAAGCSRLKMVTASGGPLAFLAV